MAQRLTCPRTSNGEEGGGVGVGVCSTPPPPPPPPPPPVPHGPFCPCGRWSRGRRRGRSARGSRSVCARLGPHVHVAVGGRRCHGGGGGALRSAVHARTRAVGVGGATRRGRRTRVRGWSRRRRRGRLMRGSRLTRAHRDQRADVAVGGRRWHGGGVAVHLGERSNARAYARCVGVGGAARRGRRTCTWNVDGPAAGGEVD